MLKIIYVVFLFHKFPGMEMWIGASIFSIIIFGLASSDARTITANNKSISDDKVSSLVQHFLTQNLSSSCRSAIQKVCIFWVNISNFFQSYDDISSSVNISKCWFIMLFVMG